MRVHNGCAKIVRVEAGTVAVTPFEHMPVAPMGSLNQERRAPKVWLEESAEWRITLSEHQMEVVGHDDVGEELDVRIGDLFAQERHEPCLERR